MKPSLQNPPPSARPLREDLSDPQFWVGLAALVAVIVFTFTLLTVLGGAQ